MMEVHSKLQTDSNSKGLGIDHFFDEMEGHRIK